MVATRLLLVVAAVIAAVIELDARGSAAGLTSPTASGYLTCTTSGARVTVGGSTTTRYVVTPNHVTCAFANRWVTRLSYEQGAPFSGAISGGPPGWHCFAAGAGKRAASGSCTDDTGARSFSWAASLSQPAAPRLCIAEGAPFTPTPGGSTITHYKIDVRGLTCAFAKPWVTQLSYRHVVLVYKRLSNGTRQASGQIPGGPQGFECVASTLEAHQRARVGECHNRSGRKSFGWIQYA
jgi:hypothetical protein